MRHIFFLNYDVLTSNKRYVIIIVQRLFLWSPNTEMYMLCINTVILQLCINKIKLDT